MKNKTIQPRKQRKRLYKSHNFKKHRRMSVRLSKSLREKYNVKNIPVRAGDVVYVTSGSFFGTEGKVLTLHYTKSKVEIEGISREKADKSKLMYPVHTSKIVIRRFGKMDQSRKKIIERKAKSEVEILDEDITSSEDFEEE